MTKIEEMLFMKRLISRKRYGLYLLYVECIKRGLPVIYKNTSLESLFWQTEFVLGEYDYRCIFIHWEWNLFLEVLSKNHLAEIKLNGFDISEEDTDEEILEAHKKI